MTPPLKWSATPPLHPHKIATAATLVGHTASMASASSILLLGLDDPGDVIPFAFYLPGAGFTAVDANAAKLGAVHDALSALELENVELVERPLTASFADLGPFDYIIVRDALSHLDGPACAELINAAERALSAQGLLAVGYNALPGWQPVADFTRWIRDHLERKSIEGDTGKAVRELVAPLLPPDEGEPPVTRAALAALSNAISRMDDDELERLVLDTSLRGHRLTNVAALASDAGLHYLGDSDRRTAEAQLAQELRDDMTERELSPVELDALVDLSMPRPHRYSIFGRHPQSPRLEDAVLDLEVRFIALHLLPEKGEVDLKPEVETFVSSSGTSLEIESRHLRVTLGILSELWPQAVSVLGALDRASNALASVSSEWAARVTSEVVEETKERLIELCSLGLAELRTEPLPIANQLENQPRVHRLARYQAAAGSWVTSPLHVEIELGSFLRALVLTLDGEHGAEDVEREMKAACEAGAFTLEVDDKPLADDMAKQLVLRSKIIEGLRSLHGLGLLANTPRQAETGEM